MWNRHHVESAARGGEIGSEVVLVHVFVEPPLYGSPPAAAIAWKVLREVETWEARKGGGDGSEGRAHGLALRSMADRVIRTAPCPVLTVRQPD